jgi:hypothetical protein
VYSSLDIRIDLWDHKFKELRGAYFNDDLGATVMIPKGLPAEPTVFSLGHELKHHLVDRELGAAYCYASNNSEPIEIGAEIFAAELIFPEQEFSDTLAAYDLINGQCTPEILVRLKRDTRTTLSFAGIAKRAEFLGFAPSGSLAKVRWRVLEEQMYGEPVYKRVIAARQRSKLFRSSNALREVTRQRSVRG